MSKDIQFKNFEFKVNSVQEDGMIMGYASTFGNMDLGMDIVEKGAFKKSIKETGGIWPILANHDPSDHIGWNMRAEEDDKGLYVEGKIDLNTQKGREKYSLAKTAQGLGAKMGLSIGYITIKQDPDRENPMVRRLKELKLLEYSIVTFPMNTMASITSLKSAAHLDQLNRVGEVTLALQQWKRLGYSEQDFKNALQNVFGAAPKNFDPAKLSQSIDDFAKILKGEK